MSATSGHRFCIIKTTDDNNNINENQSTHHMPAAKPSFRSINNPSSRHTVPELSAQAPSIDSCSLGSLYAFVCLRVRPS